MYGPSFGQYEVSCPVIHALCASGRGKMSKRTGSRCSLGNHLDNPNGKPGASRFTRTCGGGGAWQSTKRYKALVEWWYQLEDAEVVE